MVSADTLGGRSPMRFPSRSKASADTFGKSARAFSTSRAQPGSSRHRGPPFDGAPVRISSTVVRRNPATCFARW